MASEQKLWNARQQELRRSLLDPEGYRRAIDLFLLQHACVHAAEVAGEGGISFEEQVWSGLDETWARSIPPQAEHSIAWCFWHLARIEDVTMNLLLAGSLQVLRQEDWLKRLRIPYQDTGNGMSPNDVQQLSASIDIAALRGYRSAVGRRTRVIVAGIGVEQLRARVDPLRLDRVRTEAAVNEAGGGVLEYWGSLTGAGLLLMPPTRHCLVHLNEALRIKRSALKEKRYPDEHS